MGYYVSLDPLIPSFNTLMRHAGPAQSPEICIPQVFCGALARITQFADVLRDSKEQLRKVKSKI